MPAGGQDQAPPPHPRRSNSRPAATPQPRCGRPARHPLPALQARQEAAPYGHAEGLLKQADQKIKGALQVRA